MPHAAENDPQSATMQTVDPVRIRQRQPAEPQLPAGEEINGPKGPEPTRYGDWERKGRCVDF